MGTQPRITAVTGTVTGIVIGAVVSAVALLAAGCGTSPAPQRLGQALGATGQATIRGVAAALPAVAPGPYGAADTTFGLDLLAAWCRQDPKANIVFSPASLASGLGMAYLGARGQTATAMAAALHLPAAGHQLLAGLHSRAAALRGLDGPGVTVAASDQVWADPKLPTRRAFLNGVATGYGAALRQVPLLSDPAAAAADIDAAVAAATRGHIRNLVSGDGLNGVGWVLTDALYLNARWASPFERASTKPGQFTIATGQRVSASFLHGEGYDSDQAAGWTAVALPYQGGKLSMTALLPDAGAGCPALPAATLQRLDSTLARDATISTGPPSPGESGAPAGFTSATAIALPKVSLSTKATMNALLSQLGMGPAFGPAADFSGLSPQAASIKSVTHAATLQVGEKGTVAAAATSVSIYPSSAERVLRTVSFNRPYLMVVTDTATGEPLFLARVVNPLAS